MTEAETPGTLPARDELEITLLGPGYGESIVLHTGDGSWIIVDSCIDNRGDPRALGYLESIGVDPSQAVGLIVATHWHDDHIRGMSRLVEVCDRAVFSCAAALCTKEFLAAVRVWGGRHVTPDGSGVREIHDVLTKLNSRARQPVFALANRLIHSQGGCQIWSLSPGDRDFRNFLNSVGTLYPDAGQTKTRIPSVSPNEVAIVVWIGVGDTNILLGSDSEKRAWLEILQNRKPIGNASVFKIPHHGSADAHEDRVWKQMLDPEPFAVLTPWRRGGRVLPTRQDVRRILTQTGNAFATSNAGLTVQSATHRDRMVDRTIRESNVTLRRQPILAGKLRLRRVLGSGSEWKVEMFGPACHLRDYAA